MIKRVFASAALLSAVLMFTACGGNPNKQNNQETVLQDRLTPYPEEFAAMQTCYEEAEDDHGWKPLCKWQYVDLDGDGIQEVWMRDAAEEYGAFFAVSDGYFSMIGLESERFRPYTRETRDGKGYFCKSGSAGGPSYYTEIVTLQNSRIVQRYNELQVYEDVGAELDGQELSQEEITAYKEALPEAREFEPGEWNILDVTDYDRVPAHDNSAKDDRIIMDFITEMYNNSLYVENEFLEEHCTPRMLQQLRDDYEYDGEGYANWDFRSENNDSVGESAVLNIEKIDGRYYYEAVDGGWKFRNILSA
ncbi:MAG: hypothetical protein IKR96_07825, partial [Bacteroidales bacterium]|nr:hypothetical protein [Bacteroidales bacterium]